MIFKEEGGTLSSNRTSGPLQEAREYKRAAVQGCQVHLPESSISGLRIPTPPPWGPDFGGEMSPDWDSAFSEILLPLSPESISSCLPSACSQVSLNTAKESS